MSYHIRHSIPKYNIPVGVGLLHTWRRFCGDDPHLFDFQSDWVPFLYFNIMRLTPLSAEKIGLSLSHLVLEMLGPKVGLIFHKKIYYLTDLKHFVSIFP